MKACRGRGGEGRGHMKACMREMCVGWVSLVVILYNSNSCHGQLDAQNRKFRKVGIRPGEFLAYNFFWPTTNLYNILKQEKMVICGH